MSYLKDIRAAQVQEVIAKCGVDHMHRLRLGRAHRVAHRLWCLDNPLRLQSTVTGRFRMSYPNIQQLPCDIEEARQLIAAIKRNWHERSPSTTYKQ